MQLPVTTVPITWPLCMATEVHCLAVSVVLG